MPRSINSAIDQPLLGHSHRPRQGHHHKTILVAGHGFQHVGGFTQLPAGERGLRHRPHQVIDRMHLLQVERLQWNQPVFNRIVQLALDSRAVMVVCVSKLHPQVSAALLY